MRKQLEMLQNHSPSVIGLTEGMQAAVLIPLIIKEDGMYILFEIRSPKILHQPGDICFPGGVIEKGETALTAAVRETMEELLVRREQIEVLGQMDIFHGEGITIYPFAGLLKDYENTFAGDEVAQTFLVPLSFFEQTQPETYVLDIPVPEQKDFPYERINGGREYKWRTRHEKILFYQFEDKTIWGITGEIIHSFANIWSYKTRQ